MRDRIKHFPVLLYNPIETFAQIPPGKSLIACMDKSKKEFHWILSSQTVVASDGDDTAMCQTLSNKSRLRPTLSPGNAKSRLTFVEYRMFDGSGKKVIENEQFEVLSP